MAFEGMTQNEIIEYLLKENAKLKKENTSQRNEIEQLKVEYRDLQIEFNKKLKELEDKEIIIKKFLKDKYYTTSEKMPDKPKNLALNEAEVIYDEAKRAGCKAGGKNANNKIPTEGLKEVTIDFTEEEFQKLSNHDPDCCPRCRSLSFIKYGFNKGKQKYYCKDCNKFFSKTTGTLYHRSENNYVLWKKFIECEINGLTLAQESVSIGKCKTTCFNMRHKLYKAIEDIVLNSTLSGLIEIDAQYTKINLKGTKPNKMPRYSKKRGNKAAFSGISHHKICLITAVDENDNMLFRIAGLGPESIDKYLLFKDCFKEGSTLISDSKPAIKKFAQEISCSIEQIPVIANKKRYATNNNHTVSNVNQIHSELYIIFPGLSE